MPRAGTSSRSGPEAGCDAEFTVEGLKQRLSPWALNLVIRAHGRSDGRPDGEPDGHVAEDSHGGRLLAQCSAFGDAARARGGRWLCSRTPGDYGIRRAGNDQLPFTPRRSRTASISWTELVRRDPGRRLRDGRPYDNMSLCSASASRRQPGFAGRAVMRDLARRWAGPATLASQSATSVRGGNLLLQRAWRARTSSPSRPPRRSAPELELRGGSRPNPDPGRRPSSRDPGGASAPDDVDTPRLNQPARTDAFLRSSRERGGPRRRTVPSRRRTSAGGAATEGRGRRWT